MSDQPRKFRRLFWDIEVSPNVALVWRTGFQINVGPESIIKERAIICIAWKWEGEKKVHSLQWNNGDDRALLEAFIEIAATADELVAHKGNSFDLPWLRARCLKHNLPPLPEYKTVDTLNLSRRYYAFNAHKLDYLAKFLEVGGKTPTGFGLWRRIVLHNDEKALEKMVRYCRNDVAILEKVWAKLRLSAGPSSHVGVFAGGERWHCPHCGSKKVHSRGQLVTAAGTIKHRMQDQKCGRYFTINNAAFAKYLKESK